MDLYEGEGIILLISLSILLINLILVLIIGFVNKYEL